MTDQYWVLPVGGITWGQLVHGAPVAQLPDTSGMVEIELNAPFTQVCYPANPESGEGAWCEVEGTVSIQVLSPTGHGYEGYLWGAFITPRRADEGTFDGVSVVVDISPDMMGFRYGSSDIMPPTARLYVAFDVPATAGELRATRSGSMDDGALRLIVDVYTPTPTPINFRMFMASGTQPEFWTAFVNAAEIV